MILRALYLCLCILLMPLPALAQSRAATEAQFQSWLTSMLWPQARRAGIARATFDSALRGVTLDWSLPDLSPPGGPKVPQQQRQSEFGAPARYFARGTLDSATSIGRQMARQHAAALARAEARTGVPGRIILAIWGRESSYGRAAIPENAFRTLGTLAFMGRRDAYFRDEVIAALKIAQAGHAPAGAMKSSRAGALGQPQFMPSNFLKYATDGNGDGRADIWRSEADTIASIAAYLAKHGWQKGRDWGFEVTLPASLYCALEGPDQGRRIRDWAALGITRTSGRPFPQPEANEDGFLMLPAGRHGPAFLVTRNFYVLKDYNMSDLYALFVGHVGDRIQYGSGDFRTGWDTLGRMNRSDIAVMQRSLQAMGHDTGGADGLPGFRTRRSIGRWQEATGRKATCFPTASLVKALAK
ncbi:MAG: lytic murein transglycosylase [Pseudomonadota bacterium]|nr:lytic murein transglycosylase [Pseudomonadota bacterium]